MSEFPTFTQASQLQFIVEMRWRAFQDAVSRKFYTQAEELLNEWRAASMKLLNYMDLRKESQKITQFRDVLTSSQLGDPPEISFSPSQGTMDIKGSFDFTQIFPRIVM